MPSIYYGDKLIANAAALNNPSLTMPGAERSGDFSITPAQVGTVFRCTAGLTISLPDAASAGNGYWCVVVRTGGVGDVAIIPASGAEIAGRSEFRLTQIGQSILLQCDGTRWDLVSSHQEPTRRRVVRGGNLTAKAGDLISVALGVEPTTLTLPSDPLEGDTVRIEDLVGGFALSPLTISAGSMSFVGFGGNQLNINTAWLDVSFVFDSVLSAWRALGNFIIDSNAILKPPSPLMRAELDAVGSAVEFTGLPSGLERFRLAFFNVSTDGIIIPSVQIGGLGGYAVSNYYGVASYSNAQYAIGTGCPLSVQMLPSYLFKGIVDFEIVNKSQNHYAFSGNISFTTNATISIGGRVSLPEPLDRVRVIAGGDLFDSGEISVSYLV